VFIHPEQKLYDWRLSGPGRTDYEGKFVGWEEKRDACEDGYGGPGGVGDGDGGEGEFACAVLLGDDFAEVDGGRGEWPFMGGDGARRRGVSKRGCSERWCRGGSVGMRVVDERKRSYDGEFSLGEDGGCTSGGCSLRSNKPKRQP
jgi:hypothetical protein